MNEEFKSYTEFDAFTYGIDAGGLRSVSAIELLICYVVSNAGVKLTAKNIQDAVMQGGIANYFETSQAISRQIERGLISEDKDGYLSASEECKKLTEVIENDLPFTVRETSIKICKKLAELDINKKANRVDIEKKGDTYSVTMHIEDNGIEFMSLKLTATTSEQAQIIKDKFLENPAKVYDNLVNSIFG